MYSASRKWTYGAIILEARKKCTGQRGICYIKKDKVQRRLGKTNGLHINGVRKGGHCKKEAVRFSRYYRL